MSEDSGIYDFAPDDTPKGPPRSMHPAIEPPPGPVRPLPCPDCGYDLRGSRMDRCPECGKEITAGVFNRITGSNRSQIHLWRDVYREPTLWALAGLTIGTTAWGIEMGWIGAVAFPVYGLFLVVTGWVVFLLCSLVWIGFDQPLHTVAVQLGGVYLGSAGVSVLTGFIPIPLIPWLINLIVLIGLLQKLLDIDTNDAIAVAILINIARWALLIAVFMIFAF